MSKKSIEIVYNEFKPDFLKLIKEYPELKKYLILKNKDEEDIEKCEEISFDWSNNNLSLLMTKCILNYYFNIKYYDIPNNFLIPPVPSRLNYINVIQSLLSLFKVDDKNEIIGVDIGTGANIIYPILGSEVYKWKFICSEINDEAFKNGERIINKNNLENRIKVIKQKYKYNIFFGILNREKKYTFTMCNPPYYDFQDEIKIEDGKRDCEYNFDEIYYKNGEIGFFERYFEESIYFSKNVFLFSFLIGKKSNAEKIFDKIVNTKDSIKICDMKRIKNGNNIRYIIYWSFFNNYQEFLDVILYSNEYNRFRPIYNSIK